MIAPNHRTGAKREICAPVAQLVRSPKTRGERAQLKSCKDDEIIAQGNPERIRGALGKRHKMISSLFSNLVWRTGARQTRLEKKEIGCGVAFTQGGGLSGLALG
jgi:hypothetical protein